MAFKTTPYANGPARPQRLAVIRHCRAPDMPLVEVRRLLDLVTHSEANCDDINRLIDGQLGRASSRVTGELNRPRPRRTALAFD